MNRCAPPTSPPSGQDVFVVGPAQAGSRLLYRLLCLHPQVAYVSNLEAWFTWLPVSVTGRVRLHRYSSKLRYWFGEQPQSAETQVNGPLMSWLVPVPVDAEAFCRRSRTRAALDLDARAVAALRTHFARLRGVANSGVLVARIGTASRRLPVVDAVFPRARYLSVIGGDQEGTSVSESPRALARVPPSRVLRIAQEDLMAGPTDQMRLVLEFLALERRRDYEWALKALKLGAGIEDAVHGASNSSGLDARVGGQSPYPAHSEYAS